MANRDFPSPPACPRDRSAIVIDKSKFAGSQERQKHQRIAIASNKHTESEEQASDGSLSSHGVGEARNILHLPVRSRVDVFRNTVYASNLPLNKQKKLVSYFEARDIHDKLGRKGSAHNTNVNRRRRFPHFRRLPPEIRTMIWQFAVPSRVIQVRDLISGLGHGTLPVVAGACREAYYAVSALGRRDLRTGLRETQARNPSAAAPSGKSCGFLMPRDIIHYDELPLGFSQMTGVHHPTGIPAALGVSAVSVLFTGGRLVSQLKVLLQLQENLQNLLCKDSGFWYLRSLIRDWAFLARIPSLQTLYVGWHPSFSLYECRGSRAAYKSASKLAVGLKSVSGKMAVVIDLYDERRLAEVQSLEASNALFVSLGESHGWERCALGRLVESLRRDWEVTVRPAMDVLWVLLYVYELRAPDLVTILDPDAKGLNRENGWVREKLSRMPTIRPSLQVSFRSST